MSKPYTVNSLIKKLDKLKNEGLGNKYVVVSSDDEGNDYRALLNQGVLTNKDEIKEYLGEYDKSHNHYENAIHCYYEPNKIIVL